METEGYLLNTITINEGYFIYKGAVDKLLNNVNRDGLFSQLSLILAPQLNKETSVKKLSESKRYCDMMA